MTSLDTSSPEEWKLQQEEELFRKMGAAGAEYLQMNFDSSQLAEIRKGLEAGLDVSTYAKHDLTWFQMEELRTGLMSGITVEEYLDQGFDWMQIGEILKGAESGVDISIYANTDFFFLQMKELRKGLEHGLPVQKYARTEYDHLMMREIRHGMMVGIDLLPYVDRIKEGPILRQIRLAIQNKVDVLDYALQGYDEDQLEEIRIAKENGVDIDPYLDKVFYGTQLKQIRLGIVSQVDVALYATGEYTWQQMREIRIGLEEHLEMCYLRPLMTWQQMEQVRLGLEQYLDVSSYSSLMFSAREMVERREALLEEQQLEEVLDEGKETSFGNLDVNISISADRMEVTLELFPPEKGEEYTKEKILDFLHENGVIQGIDEKAIVKMIKDKMYFQPICVAEGRKRIDGADGFFTFYVRTELPMRPKVREDGSTDYHDMDLFELVKKGQQIATYTPATAGQYGYDVFGKLQVPRRGMDKPPMQGEGFLLSQDRKIYTAAIDGKVVVKDNILTINRAFILKGNLDYAVGDIRFDGDVLVTGDVLTGFAINATGNVQIGGHVEASSIYSGGSVVIKQGMNGGGVGRVEAVGEVNGNFFEESTIISKQNISANYIMNCNVSTDAYVFVSGNRGIIVGGQVRALHGVETTTLGNDSQLVTRVGIGVTDQIMNQYQEIAKQRIKVKSELEILNKGKGDIEMKHTFEQMKTQLLYSKILQAIAIKQGELLELENERSRIDEIMASVGNSKVIVRGTAYAGIVVSIDMREYKLRENIKNVYFSNIDDHIGIIRLR